MEFRKRSTKHTTSSKVILSQRFSKAQMTEEQAYTWEREIKARTT